MTRRGNTTQRSIRAGDELWIPAKAKAAAEGRDMSAVTRELWTEWLGRDAELWARTRTQARTEGLDVSTLIRQLLRGWLDLHDEQGEK